MKKAKSQGTALLTHLARSSANIVKNANSTRTIIVLKGSWIWYQKFCTKSLVPKVWYQRFMIKKPAWYAFPFSQKLQTIPILNKEKVYRISRFFFKLKV